MAIETIGADTAASTGTAVADGAANAKGSWVQLTASSTLSAQAILVTVFFSNVVEDFLVDIATGGAGAESAIINNLMFHERGNGGSTQCYYIPIPIASGTRISARSQSISGTGTVTVLAHLISTTVKLEEVSSIVTYGINTADTGGTAIDPGGVAHTKGSWVEITSSLSADVKFIIPMIGGSGNAARTTGTWLFDIGTGAAASESVVIANLGLESGSTSDLIFPQHFPPIPIEIASGTRVAVRAQSTITDATDRLFDFSMITANGTAAAAGTTGRQGLHAIEVGAV